jgi:hypothetical protein
MGKKIQETQYKQINTIMSTQFSEHSLLSILTIKKITILGEIPSLLKYIIFQCVPKKQNQNKTHNAL